MIRDAAAFQNPVDQLLSPFSDRNRTSGRDLLRKYGAAGKRDTWGNWGAGFGVEMALDPLTYVGLGGLSQAGKLAKGAGLLDDMARVAAKVKRVPMGSVGRNVARLTTTPRQLVLLGKQNAAARLTTAATKAGTKVDDIIDQPLGNLMEVGLPFGKKYGIGTAQSPAAMKIAGGLDKVSQTLRYGKIPGTGFAPGNAFMRLFDAPTQHATNPFEAETGRHLFREQTASRADARKWIAPLAQEYDALAKSGARIANPNAFRKALELPKFRAKLSQPEQDLIGKIRARLDATPGEAREWGINLERYVDPKADYAPRFITEGRRKDGGRQGKPYASFFSSKKGRLDFLHGVVGGTVKVKRILKDPALEQLINSGATPKKVRKFLEQKWVKDLPPEFLTRKQRGQLKDQLKKLKIPSVPPGVAQVALAKSLGIKPKNTFQAFGSWAARLSPESRQSGVFGNHPMADLLHGVSGYQDARTSAEVTLQALANPGVLKLVGKAAAQRDYVRLPTLLQKLGLNTGDDQAGAAKKLLELTGVTADPKAIKALRRMGVKKDLARHLLKLNKGFEGPEVADDLTGVFDSAQNLFKASVTSPWPGFQARNLISGQFNNWVADQFSAKSLKEGNQLVRGGTVEGASQIPAVQQLAQEQGIANLTDDVATKLLGQLAYAHKVTGKYEGQAVSTTGKSSAMHGADVSDILQEIPGHQPITLKSAGKKLLGRQGTTWNPLKATARGVGGQMESTFAPLAAGEDVGHYVESANRLSPFIELLKQGVDPAEAAKRVGEAQVQYANRHYTPFERQIVGRLAPFAKFTKGQIPFTAKQLAEQPGGKLAQTVRAMNTARGDEEVTPDYVAETASIPLGTLKDGSRRYIAGFGLPFEDPLKFAGSNPGFELLNRATPFVKLPLEMATGRSMFQENRDLGDMDPTVGRILANVGNMTGLRESRQAVRIPGGRVLEPLLANSPATKALTALRTATDSRKGILGRALNLGTGVRLTDVSPAAQDALLRERAQELEKSLGAREFQKTWLPDDAAAKMSEQEKKEWAQLEALRKILEARAKGRKS
jgi:hypothetical protein